MEAPSIITISTNDGIIAKGLMDHSSASRAPIEVGEVGSSIASIVYDDESRTSHLLHSSKATIVIRVVTVICYHQHNGSNSGSHIDNRTVSDIRTVAVQMYYVSYILSFYSATGRWNSSKGEAPSERQSIAVATVGAFTLTNMSRKAHRQE
jgi:hypothetical protein